MQYRKNIVLLGVVLCTALLIQAQSQLPSLFDDAQEQNTYLQNTVLKPGEKPEDKIRSQIFIKTTVSKRSCYVGEPVLVVYQLYTALYCQPKVVKQPSFSGCSLVEMTTDEPEYIEKADGKMYRVLLIRRVQLTPLQEGELVIPPAVVNNEVGFTTADNPYRMQNYSAAVSSRPDSIQVKALPLGTPADYSGIAGRFTISAKVDSTSISQGESDLLQVTISGEGNIDAIQAPSMVWPPGIEHFEGNDSQHVNKASFPVRGDKTFAIPFIGTKRGTFAIPQLRFTFFNTALQQFETIVTQPIVVTITKASPAKQKDEHIVTTGVSNKKYLWFVPGIALIVLIVWVIGNKRKENHTEALKNQAAGIRAGAETNILEKKTMEVEQPSAVAKDRPDTKILLQALSKAEDNAVFFTNAKTLLTVALQQALGTAQQNEKELTAALAANNAALAEATRKLYAVCNASLYAPSTNEDARAMLIERLGDVIQTLENNQAVYL